MIGVSAGRGRATVLRLVQAAGWLLLAYVVGWLVVAPTSSGWIGFALGSAGLLAAVVVTARLGGRWPLLGDPLFRASVLLAGLALLVAANRNTPLGNAPVRWVAMLLSAAAAVVALVGATRRREGSAVWRWWGLVGVTVSVLTGVAVDGFGAYRTEAVAVANGEARLRGTVLVPRGEPPFPLVLFIHGAGAEPALVSRHMADRMAREGVAALLWDKRGTGDSVGGSPRDDFAALASDVVAWVEHLQDRPDVDGDRIGLWGWSEGAWIAPLAAQQLDGVAALVLVSPGVGFGDTFYFELGWRMRNAGFSQAEAERAIALRRRIDDYYRSGEARAAVLAELQAVRDNDWYQAAVDVGLLPWPDDVTDPDDPATVTIMERHDFTLLTSLADFDGPVLAAFGLQDQCNPARDGADTIQAALTNAGNDHRILRYPDAGHVILVWLTGEQSCGLGIPPVSYPAGFVDETTRWLADNLRTRPTTAGVHATTSASTPHAR